MRTLRLGVRPAIALAAALLVTAGLTACSSDSNDRLTIYSGRTKDLIGPLLEQFNEETGIDIDVRYGDSPDLALLIEEEGDQSPADVFLSQSPGATGYLDELGRLEPLPDDVLDIVEPRFRADDGSWVGVSGRVRTLVYNRDEVSESDLPASVFDLTDPFYEGQVGVAPTNGSFQDFVTTMREQFGNDETEAWLNGMADNGAQSYPDNVSIVDAVARGEIAYGLVNHYYNEQLLAEEPDAPSRNYYFPDRDVGSLLLVTAASALDTAGDQTDNAEELIEFLLSEESQQFYADETLEYPLRPGVLAPSPLPSLDELDVDTVDLTNLGSGLIETRGLIADSGLEQS
ncbi:MAG: iron ABC transporter substrate-binding protein [Acidimicrobiia bacterium]